MSIADIARRAAKFAVDNSPSILTALGVAGTVTTAYLAGKASFQAADIIRLKEADDENRGVLIGTPREVVKDRVQLVWRLYIPTGMMAGATVACIIAANHVGGRRAASIAAAYSLTEKTFSEYKDKVVDRIGERKAEGIHDEIARDRIAASHREGVEIVGGNPNEELCYDMFIGRYFWGSVEGIRAAVNDLNNNINHNGYASLAELYHFLDLPAPPVAESLGWNSDRLVDVRTGAELTPSSRPCITMFFKNDPLPDYGRFR